MQKRVLAIIMSLLMVIAFMPSMAFATDGPETVFPAPDCKAPVKHAGEAIDQIGFSCQEGAIEIKKCADPDCDAVWAERAEAKAEHKLVLKKMSVEEAYDLVEEDAGAALDEFVLEILADDDPAETIPAFIDEIGKILLGIQYEDKAVAGLLKIANEKIEGATNNIKFTEEGKLTNESIKYIQKELGADIKAIISAYYFDVAYNLGQYNMDQMKSHASVDFPACYALVSACKVCGENVEVRLVKHEGKAKADCATTFVCDECGKTIKTAKVSHYTADVAEMTKKAAAIVEDIENKDEALLDKNVADFANYMYFFDNAGKHDYEVTVETKKCGKILTFTCKKCGEDFSFVVPTSVLKHNYEWVTVNEASCASINEKNLPMDGNLGMNGLKVKKCKECGAIDLTSFTPVAPKHNFVEKVVEPTCATYGYTVQVCEDCGKYIPGTIKNFVKPIGHDYNVEMLVEPSCGNDGLLKIECKNGCEYPVYIVGNEILDNFNTADITVDKMSEALDAIAKLKEPSPIVAVYDKLHSKTHYYFIGFNKELLLKPIEIESTIGGYHQFDTCGVLSEATCEHGTQWARKCSKCGYIDVHATAYANADADDAEYFYVEDADQLDHQITTTVGKEPTCGQRGFHYNYCSLCGKYYDVDKNGNWAVIKNVNSKKDARVYDEPIVDYGHKCTPADKWTTLVEPTFTENGTRVKICTVCGDYCDSDDIGKLELSKAYQPKLSSPAKGKMKVKIQKANKYATGYQIAYKKAGGNYKFVKVEGKTPTKTFKNLAKGKKYTVKVRAYRVEGNKTFYGDYCTIKSVKVK